VKWRHSSPSHWLQTFKLPPEGPGQGCVPLELKTARHKGKKKKSELPCQVVPCTVKQQDQTTLSSGCCEPAAFFSSSLVPSLACLPTMPLFVLGTWSHLSPTLCLSPWPAGVEEAVTPRPGTHAWGPPVSSWHPSLMGSMILFARF
jgi:hypothetical protein